jgi:hypothetical protein
MGGVLAVISLAIYLLVSKLYLRRRRSVAIIALCWATFWFFHPLGKIIARGDDEFSERKIAIYLLVFIIMAAFILRHINMSRLVANTIAVLLCFLFSFNFVPQAMAVSSGERQRAYNKKTGDMPYKIKTEFNVDPNLSKPNVYWLHMDSMIGFDAVERYFNDPQTALKNDLAERGFVINKKARLEAGNTYFAIPSLLSPVFYDSYLSVEFAKAAQIFTRVGQFARAQRETFLEASMTTKGVSLEDIYPQIEILKAFSDAGYINIGNYISQSKNMDILVDGVNVTTRLDIKREADNTFNILVEFKELITEASALSVIKPRIDEILEKRRPTANNQPIPTYQEIVNKYITDSDYDKDMANKVKAMKYTTSVQSPHFVYFVNNNMHALYFGTVVGEVKYEKPVGWTFFLNENGNYYKEPLYDPIDVQLYLPQHKYIIKQMMAQIDTIIEDDPDAVVILQADHGMACYGYNNYPFDFKTMFVRGYNLEDQLNFNFNVISAVRLPPQYGKLSQPLDPLDIARYLVNNFVGKGNYDYLYYKEENPQ